MISSVPSSSAPSPADSMCSRRGSRLGSFADVAREHFGEIQLVAPRRENTWQAEKSIGKSTDKMGESETMCLFIQGG